MRRTKIVATLGPASSNLTTLRKMVATGVDIVRLNFSHGTATEKQNLVETVRQAAKAENKIVGILADLQGPKIRIARFKEGKINLKEGATFILDASLDKNAGDKQQVGIDYKELPQDVKPDDILLLDDGRLILVVKKITGPQIICEVQVGGALSNNKGINRKGGGLSAGALTDKDREDLKTAASLNVDYIAISFVRSQEDVTEAKELLSQTGSQAGIISKIERLEAIVPETLKEIIQASDGIMVARGDLAVEIGEAEVPAAQKLMIDYSRLLHKPVITATQMMETMIHSVVPTRAEVSDVANAVLDGTDAVMLSAETAVGDHPDLVIKTMARVCLSAEKIPSTLESNHKYQLEHQKTDQAIAIAAMEVAKRLTAKAVIALTETSQSALWVSRIRSDIPIYGLSHNSFALGRMALYSNVYPIEFDNFQAKTSLELKQAAICELQKKGILNSGDWVAITCGDDIGVSGTTNTLTVLEVK